VLASAGADVVITARTAEKGEAAAQQVRSTGAKVGTYLLADLLTGQQQD